jgi:hypothetical protein
VHRRARPSFSDIIRDDMASWIAVILTAVRLFPGFTGATVGLLIFPTLWTVAYKIKKFETYNLDPRGTPGAFEPLLAKYIRTAEFVIGLASGSIVLLVGSSALHSTGRLPWIFATPLLLLAFCVIYGIFFNVLLVLNYENVQHGNAHTKLEYSRSEALGFSSLACFCLGYLSLIFAVTR